MKGTLANNPNGANDAAVKGGLWPRMKNLINIVVKSKTYTFAGLNDMHGIVKCHVIFNKHVKNITIGVNLFTFPQGFCYATALKHSLSFHTTQFFTALPKCFA